MNNIKILKGLIREVVSEEITKHKAEILKEIKAELFDVMVTQKSATRPTEQASTPATRNGKSLKELFNTVQESFEPAGRVVTRKDLPSTFEGNQLTEKHEEVLEVINKDYSQLMKKMGIK